MTLTAADLDGFADALKALRTAYEKYFAGLEKLLPAREHDRLRQELRRLQNDLPGNTALRFRLQSLQASLVTHESHWTRLCQQIEAGTRQRKG